MTTTTQGYTTQGNADARPNARLRQMVGRQLKCTQCGSTWKRGMAQSKYRSREINEEPPIHLQGKETYTLEGSDHNKASSSNFIPWNYKIFKIRTENAISNSKIQWLNLHAIVWQLPLLAQPGPANDAIHCALLSLFIASVNLMASSLLPAASLAAGVTNPTLAKRHMAWALTAVVDRRRRYWPTTIPSWCSDSCLPVALTMWATFASAQVCTNVCRSLLPSPQWPTKQQQQQQPTNVDFQYPKSAYCRLRECNDLVFVRNGILRESQVTSRSVELLNRSLNPVLLACLLAGCRTPPLYCWFACEWQDNGLGCILSPRSQTRSKRYFENEPQYGVKEILQNWYQARDTKVIDVF